MTFDLESVFYGICLALVLAGFSAAVVLWCLLDEGDQ